jgi:hypothetical protein
VDGGGVVGEGVLEGPSPRARGAEDVDDGVDATEGTIPAWAGSRLRDLQSYRGYAWFWGTFTDSGNRHELVISIRSRAHHSGSRPSPSRSRLAHTLRTGPASRPPNPEPDLPAPVMTVYIQVKHAAPPQVQENYAHFSPQPAQATFL